MPNSVSGDAFTRPAGGPPTTPLHDGQNAVPLISAVGEPAGVRALRPRNGMLAQQWPLFLDVLEKEGAMGFTRPDTDLFRAWAKYKQARKHMIDFVDTLRRPTPRGRLRSKSCRPTPTGRGGTGSEPSSA